MTRHTIAHELQIEGILLHNEHKLFVTLQMKSSTTLSYHVCLYYAGQCIDMSFQQCIGLICGIGPGGRISFPFGCQYMIPSSIVS